MTLILSGTNGVSDIDGDASTPALRGTDANSGVFFGSDVVGVSTGGSEKVSVGASALVINDGGADFDFRVESDTDANAFFVEGSSGNVGIGTSSPTTITGYRIVTLDGTTGSVLDLRGGGTLGARVAATASSMYLETGGAIPMLFWTNSTERMRIDSSGRVTMPYQPMFSAYGLSGSISAGTVLVPNNETFDVGGNYNTSNGRFTAPIAGKYFFVFQLFCVASTTATYQGLTLRKNASNLAYTMYNYIDTANDVFVTNSKIIDLAAGDYVDVRFEIGGGGTQNDSRLTFDGFLVG